MGATGRGTLGQGLSKKHPAFLIASRLFNLHTLTTRLSDPFNSVFRKGVGSNPTGDSMNCRSLWGSGLTRYVKEFRPRTFCLFPCQPSSYHYLLPPSTPSCAAEAAVPQGCVHTSTAQVGTGRPAFPEPCALLPRVVATLRVHCSATFCYDIVPRHRHTRRGAWRGLEGKPAFHGPPSVAWVHRLVGGHSAGTQASVTGPSVSRLRSGGPRSMQTQPPQSEPGLPSASAAPRRSPVPCACPRTRAMPVAGTERGCTTPVHRRVRRRGSSAQRQACLRPRRPRVIRSRRVASTSARPEPSPGASVAGACPTDEPERGLRQAFVPWFRRGVSPGGAEGPRSGIVGTKGRVAVVGGEAEVVQARPLPARSVGRPSWGGRVGDGKRRRHVVVQAAVIVCARGRRGSAVGA